MNSICHLIYCFIQISYPSEGQNSAPVAEEVLYKSNKATISGTLTLPPSEASSPAVVLVSGDSTTRNEPMLVKLGDQLNKLG